MSLFAKAYKPRSIRRFNCLYRAPSITRDFFLATCNLTNAKLQVAWKPARADGFFGQKSRLLLQASNFETIIKVWRHLKLRWFVYNFATTKIILALSLVESYGRNAMMFFQKLDKLSRAFNKTETGEFSNLIWDIYSKYFCRSSWQALSSS